LDDGEFHPVVVALVGDHVAVELGLQQRIDGAVEVEREAPRAVDAEPSVYVEAARALDEAVDLRARDFEGLPAGINYLLPRLYGLAE
jgi:hypothetical protein